MRNILEQIKKQIEKKAFIEVELEKIISENKVLSAKLNSIETDITSLQKTKKDYKIYSHNLKTWKKIMITIIVTGILSGLGLTLIANLVKNLNLVPSVIAGTLFSTIGFVMASVFLPNYLETKEFLANNDISKIINELNEKEKEKKSVNEKIATNSTKITQFKTEISNINLYLQNVTTKSTLPPVVEQPVNKTSKQKKIGTKKQ